MAPLSWMWQKTVRDGQEEALQITFHSLISSLRASSFEIHCGICALKLRVVACPEILRLCQHQRL